MILADRGFHRASFIAWLVRQHLHYVVRIRKGSCITEKDGRRWKLGEEGLKIGELRFMEEVRYGLYHDRPRELLTNVALCWRVSKSLSEGPPAQAARGAVVPGYESQRCQDGRRLYWQRGWIEQSFKDSKSRFGLARVRVGSPERLSRLLMALSVALTWLSLMGLPESGVLPEGFRAAVSAWGRVSVTGMALSLLEKLENIPLCCLPRTSTDG